MKPPPRTRSKPKRFLQRKHEHKWRQSKKLFCTWKRTEKKQLLTGLKKLQKTVGETGEIDYTFLDIMVPTRSVSEIQSVVEALKAKVISFVTHQLMRQRREEREVKKPIELWTDMASVMAGVLEEPISAAFSRMFIVSSTEPCSLRNSDPPPSHNANRTAGRSVPCRTTPHHVVPGQLPSKSTTNAAFPPLILKTPASTMGPARRLPAPSKVVRVATAAISPAQRRSCKRLQGTSSAVTSTSQSVTSSHQPGTTEMVEATSRSPLQSATLMTPIPGNQNTEATCKSQQLGHMSIAGAAALTSGTPVSQASPQRTEPAKGVGVTAAKPQFKAQTTAVAQLSESAVLFQPLSQTVVASPTPVSSSVPTKQHSSPSTSIPTTVSSIPPSSSSSSSTPSAALRASFGQTSRHSREDCSVDFEKIYCYLSIVHKKNEACALTPMESAVVLDLLMSLPEELPLLDCSKLQQHMDQIYSCLSAPADSKMAREMFGDQQPQREGDGKDADEQNMTLDTNASPSSNPLQISIGNDKVIGPKSDQHRSGKDSTSLGNVATATVGMPIDLAEGRDVSCVKWQETSRETAAVGSSTVQQGDSQPSESNNTSVQLENWQKKGLCPLNPFVVPLKLLKRRQK
ncbi:uncharacterized protein snapc2 [Polymixia lowei]